MADNIDTILDEEAEYGVNTVCVEIPVSKYQNTYLPIDNQEQVLSCIFLKPSVEDNLVLEKLSFTERTENRLDFSFCDFNLYRKLLLRKCLLKFGNQEMKRQNGWILKEDWNKLLKTNAMILSSVLSKFEYFFTPSEDEDQRISRQAGILFGSENSKITNPVPSLSLYCTLASIWDKFGISVDTLKKMSSEDYIRLRIIMSKEAEAMKSKK